MNIDRIAELRAELSKGPVPVLCGQEIADLLATAEREAKLRQDIQTFVEGYGAVFIAPDNSDPPRLWLWAGDPHDETAEPLIPFAALESKGGE